jgi:site-specific DNA recombinase
VDPTTVISRIKELEDERDSIAAKLAEFTTEPRVVTLHPASIEKYCEDVARLADLLAEGRDGERDELIASVRGLVAAVVVYTTPGANGFEVEVQGRLAQLTNTPMFPACTAPAGRW